MFLVFFSTSDVFKSEERFQNNGVDCSVVPTPVQDKAYCGVCLKLDANADLSIVTDIEYERIEE